ncbi:MAG TPA: hypothetical protein VJB60_00765 [Candidatus Peribacterales bacterium]|nr:hypothetical protein [Candidatus Peribacterales bacterium]
MNARLLLSLLALSLALSTPSLMRLPQVLPFLEADVRAASPLVLKKLRNDGLWLVNVDMQSVTRDERGLCFHFEHRYTGRGRNDAPELLTACEQ